MFFIGTTSKIKQLVVQFLWVDDISTGGIYAFLFSKSCKVRCARAIKAYMPVSLITLITSEDWKGGALLDLSESRGIKTPSAKEISRNYSFLKPVVQLYPTHVPYSDLNAKFF